MRKVDSGGTITTIAGTGDICSPNFVCGDGGPATAATLQQPVGVALDAQGSLYIAMAARVRKVDSAGNDLDDQPAQHDPGAYPGDGLPAIVAKIRGPYAVAVDGQGSLYVAEFLFSTGARVPARSTSGPQSERDDRVRCRSRLEDLWRPRLHGQRDGELGPAGQLRRQRQLHDQRERGCTSPALGAARSPLRSRAT